jgi:glycerate 2-kinase
MDPHRQLLRQMFDAAVIAAQPSAVLLAFLPQPPKGRTVVVGAGKASAAMARALEDHWPHPLTGCVVTRDGHAVPCRTIEIVEASHPVPDERALMAGTRILEMVKDLTEDDLVIALISGGGSSLLSVPAPGLTLDDKQAINRSLLASGASIGEMNCVRKHLSAVKGGRLAAAAHPARVVSLLISDVPGDDPSVIASGPTVADTTTFADALEILDKYGIREPEAAIRHLASASQETPKPNDLRLATAELAIIARPQASLDAAATVAAAGGLTPWILGDSIEGEARDVARVIGAIARQVARQGQPVAAPCVLISGGETTVTIRGNGRGGRNVEFLLALAIALDGEDGVWAIAGDTDGIDGAEETAGAIITPDTLQRARAKGMDPKAYLRNNDGHGFFEALGDQVVTGPTLTNVNDFRAVIIGSTGMSRD